MVTFLTLQDYFPFIAWLLSLHSMVSFLHCIITYVLYWDALYGLIVKIFSDWLSFFSMSMELSDNSFSVARYVNRLFPFRVASTSDIPYLRPMRGTSHSFLAVDR